MSILEVLSTFDVAEKKGFDTHTIISALMSLNEEEKKKSEFEYEYLAFSLVPSRHIVADNKINRFIFCVIL